MTIVDALRRHAADEPSRPALIEPETGKALSFGELNARVESLAAAFREELGLRPFDRVAVLSRNTAEFFVIYLACARARVIAHGLNWRLAEPALREALIDSGPRLVIVQDRYAAVAEKLREHFPDSEWLSYGPGSDGGYEELVCRGGRRSLADEATGLDDPYLILCTGGTTGGTKAAVHSHGTLAAAMTNNTVAERIVPSDRYLLIGQAFHSAAVLALNYLRHGCALVVMDFEPKASLEVIENYGVTCFLGFPTMLTHMLDHGAQNRYNLSSLRNIQYGGGAFADDTILGMLQTFPATLIQCYGTTESIGITFLDQEHHARAVGGERGLLRSCGSPAALTDIRVDRTSAPPSDRLGVGEVQVRSPSNMLGYWSAPQLQQSRVEWLSTGDLGYLEKGLLYIVGRSKEVIISGGENIYASQVENVIFGHPDVVEVAVVGVPDAVWGEAVKAVVVLRPAASATGSDIQDWVAARLARYQRPKYVEFVAELPRTATGKVLKRELSAT